jgi:hypothetical protein
MSGRPIRRSGVRMRHVRVPLESSDGLRLGSVWRSETRKLPIRLAAGLVLAGLSNVSLPTVNRLLTVIVALACRADLDR